MDFKRAIRKFGPVISEEVIGSEDRLIEFSNGVWAWQARGSSDCWPALDIFKQQQCGVTPKEAAKVDYLHT